MSPPSRLPLLIHQEHAVGVAVEGDAHVAVLLRDDAAQILGVLRLDGAGGMVGERAIQLEVERDELAGQLLEDARDDHAGHAVAGVHRDLVAA